MKKIAILISAMLVLSSFAFAAGQGEAAVGAEKTLRVGMVTDAGTIDDKSFNQGTWEGIVRAGKDFGFTPKYQQPAGETEPDYLSSISDLADAGYEMIICPGFKFETAIFKAQYQYPDVKFVILDGVPHAGDYNVIIEDNTVGVSWAEQESGFVAAIAAALKMPNSKFGYIGGMEIPAVQKFNWGWQQGINYANENLGTNVSIAQEDCLYSGSFNDVALGQQMAATMFDRGVDIVFAAAGGVGVGVINECKSQRTAGKDKWVVGVDIDQYADGMMPNGKSCILTSAMKYLDRASYDMIEDELNGRFPGGQALMLTANEDGVGIPAVNPNLTPEIEAQCAKVMEMMKAGEIVVAGEKLPNLWK